MDNKQDLPEEDFQDVDEDGFPWEDIDVCRGNKRPEGSDLTESDIRARLQNSIAPCPKCRKSFKDMEVFYFASPAWTWQHLCGRAGWMVICQDCKKQIWFKCEIMN